MRPGERALVAAVLGTGAAVERLGPALMRAHAAADHVVGLDVDRDDFDKFAYRSRIDSLLMELWNDEGACSQPEMWADQSYESLQVKCS